MLQSNKECTKTSAINMGSVLGEEHSSCTRHPYKQYWETQASLDAWEFLRICHKGFTGCSMMGKFSHFWAKDQGETLQSLAPSQRASCEFFHRRDRQMSNVCRKPFRLAESWNSPTCYSLTFTISLLVIICSWYELGNTHGINRHRGKNSLSFVPLPCLWTKKNLLVYHWLCRNCDSLCRCYLHVKPNSV